MRKTLKKEYGEKDRTVCRICNEKFEHLGSHIYHAHGIKANDYKAKFGLAKGLSLISETVEKKKKEKFNEDREKYLKNITGANSLKHRFKKGSVGKKRYFARRERERVKERIQDENKNKKPELCPVCNIKFKHLDSHLFNKHKLIRVKQ